MSVLGALNPHSPEKVFQEQKTKKCSLSKTSIDKDLKALDAKWLERFSQLEAMLVARTLEKLAEATFQTVTVTPSHRLQQLTL